MTKIPAGQYGDILFRPGDYTQKCTSNDVIYTANQDTTLLVGHPPGPAKNEFFQIPAGHTLTIKHNGDIVIV